jgi:hypothetical protein
VILHTFSGLLYAAWCPPHGQPLLIDGPAWGAKTTLLDLIGFFWFLGCLRTFAVILHAFSGLLMLHGAPPHGQPVQADSPCGVLKTL